MAAVEKRLAEEPALRPAISVLVLNASYEVLSVARWQRALCMVITGKAEVIEDTPFKVHSTSLEMAMPSVIRMNYYIKVPRLCVPFSRSNVFLRDQYACQYCGETFHSQALTLDHVIPRSAGGVTCWENVVTACRHCNALKGDKTPEQTGMRLLSKPKSPFYSPSLHLHFRKEWGKYIPFIVSRKHITRH